MIHFRKILPYSLTPLNGDVFDYLDSLTQQTIDPPSLQIGSLQPQEPIVFCSPLKRAVSTIASNYHGQRIFVPELREIPFSLKKLCTRAEWEAKKSEIVRRRFRQAFLENTLPLSRAEIKQEIQSLLTQLKPFPDALIISHSFRLKLIETYLKTNGAVFQHPKMIRDWMCDDQKTYEFGYGFDVSNSLLK